MQITKLSDLIDKKVQVSGTDQPDICFALTFSGVQFKLTSSLSQKMATIIEPGSILCG